MADQNTAAAKFPPGCLPVKCTDGTTAHVRISEMRAEFHDFILEVYPQNSKFYGTVQIGDDDSFCLDRVRRNFRADCGVDVDLKTYEEWDQLMGRMQAEFEKEAKS